MSRTVYRQGGVEVTLDVDIEALIRQAASAATGGALEAMEAAAEEVAADARRQWYGPPTGVTRETGQSGEIEVVTTVNDEEVRVSLGSTDTRRAGGKPLVVYVRRPRRTSMVDEEITAAEYHRLRREGKEAHHLQSGKYVRPVLNPAASDGKFLLAELIRNPMKRRSKQLAAEIGRAIAARTRRGT